MNTRHLYTFQDGRVLVLEHIVAIGSPYPSSRDEEVLFFQVDMLGNVCYCYPDVGIEETAYGYLKADGTQDSVTYTTTERAKLLKALSAI